MIMQPYILLYSGTGPISRAIRWQTRSRYSHSAILIGDTIYEAREGKGTIRRSATTEDAAAEAFIVPTFCSEDLPDLESWLMTQAGKGYDYTMVFRFLTRRQETRRSTQKWFCSELTFAAFIRLGYALLARTEPWEVAPGWLPRSPLIEAVDNPLRNPAYQLAIIEEA